MWIGIVYTEMNEDGTPKLAPPPPPPKPALTNGISNGRGSQVRGNKKGGGKSAVLSRNLELVGGAGGAAGGSTGSTVRLSQRHGDIRASGTRMTPDAKRKSTIFGYQTSYVQWSGVK